MIWNAKVKMLGQCLWPAPLIPLPRSTQEHFHPPASAHPGERHKEQPGPVAQIAHDQTVKVAKPIQL